jgi:hypothetical protein
VRIAKTDYIIGADFATGKPCLYGVTRWIDGKNLKSIVFLDKKTAVQIDELYAKIISGSIAAYFTNGYFWFDPKNEQFVFGKAEGDKKPHIYLVDVDPNVFRWGDDEVKQRFDLKKETLFFAQIQQIVYDLNDLERKITEKCHLFSKTRKRIERIKRKMPDSIKKPR